MKREYGFSVDCDDYYRAVEEWNRWYSGTDESFHKVVINNGISVCEREMYRLYMAKKVAEDWANLLMNEKTRINLSHKHSAAVLMGEDGNGGILGENDFKSNINRLVEQTFALGSGAAVCYLENANIDPDGNLEYSPEAKIRIDWLSAGNIIPLSWQQDRLLEAAFISDVVFQGERFSYLQVHRLENGKYVINSHFFKENEFSLKEVSLPSGTAKTVRTGNSVPWFTLFKPNIVNNLFPELPMGISVFAGCRDILKGIDLCYDSLNMEFYLGKKMVFLRKDLLSEDSEGYLYAPQDSNKQLFMYVGDKTLDGDIMGFIGGVVGWFMGGFDPMIILLVVFVAVDYISGVAAAYVNKTLSSSVGFKGIVKKILIFFLVGMGHILDVCVFGEGAVMRTAVIFFYVANEGISIIENCSALSLPVPDILKNALAKIKDRSGEKELSDKASENTDDEI